jgi:hypothetical protein
MQLKQAVKLSAQNMLLLGASYAGTATIPSENPTNFFNGRLDSPSIATTGTSPTTLVKFDFSRDMSSDFVIDISGQGHNGKLINAPTRAVKGHDWNGTANDWTKEKYGYGAIHFHDDGLDDAEWETDVTITIQGKHDQARTPSKWFRKRLKTQSHSSLDQTRRHGCREKEKP